MRKKQRFQTINSDIYDEAMKDVVGNDTAKRELYEAIESDERSIKFFGPENCGKTYFATIFVTRILKSALTVVDFSNQDVDWLSFQVLELFCKKNDLKCFFFSKKIYSP